MLDVLLVSRTLTQQRDGDWVPRSVVFKPNGEQVEIFEFPAGFTSKFNAVKWLDDCINQFAHGQLNVYVSTKLTVLLSK